MDNEEINFNTDDEDIIPESLKKAMEMFRQDGKKDDFKDVENLNEKTEEEEESNITPPDFEEDETISIENNETIGKDEFENAEKTQEMTPWEETDDDNSVVKKYIIYVSKDYVPYIDDLTLDERSAFINDALEMKISAQSKEKQLQYKRRLILHFIVAFIVVCLTVPVALIGVHKAIMATFENYKYSQDNFEKLYKRKFEKDKAYIRSVQYNKMMEKKSKNK